ncbi:MAG: hypothetical protein COW32_03485 [Candidatus Aquicultor secundus]|uniref:Flavin reductase like domain-containing protein n=1 Tax=Candidatus Aquicultor secundus TaxID=1973895 RepID=A0A2M7T8T1_9ACTN|nr:flavin reductase family protein [Candidatus Aquicultor secundus]NCO65385.1 flavin reductase family protein [Solirubrobacter sp.]OIO88328.1 MAG: hypothetical protein AUK32_01830 [Candidatus Aquicultor secundus]PIU26306.1 MAG: hypothetical protein COT10_09320 [Candidatus Aquicultor secundus]PIW22651.1 MAG: hypothetical protein COW32_03485 [Candidatus Aquicultor secundus]PIX52464.1 MAG: hypothetical protein COZ51_04015 [Candidatus Aquicultor secundus]
MRREFTGKKAMGAIGGPVVFITGAFSDQIGIMTANMLAGVTFAPPQVCVSLSHHSHTRSLIEPSGEFAVNAISPEQMELAKLIGRTTGNRVDKFKQFNVETFEGRIVQCPLVKAAYTVLECKVIHSLDLGTHTLYVGEVVGYHEPVKGSPLYLYHGNYYTLGEQIGSYK